MNRRVFLAAGAVASLASMLPQHGSASLSPASPPYLAASADAQPPRHVIMDTDTASDDAIALLLALFSPKSNVEAITIVAGNVDFDQETENALYTVEIAGRSGQVPVYCGARRPLVRPVHRFVNNVHGKDGMGDSFFPKARQRPESEHAVDAIIRLVNKYPGQISIVAIGPLTNIGLALLREPAIAPKIVSLFFMGGTYQFYGNITPSATYNVWVDPEAARIVMHSGIPLTFSGFDASCRYSVFTDDDYNRVEQLGTKLGRFFCDINRTRRVFCKEKQRLAGSNHPDTLTTALFLDPSVGKRVVKRYADIETAGELTVGEVVIDELGVWGKPPNLNICAEADEQKFKSMVFSVLRSTEKSP